MHRYQQPLCRIQNKPVAVFKRNPCRVRNQPVSVFNQPVAVFTTNRSSFSTDPLPYQKRTRCHIENEPVTLFNLERFHFQYVVLVFRLGSTKYPEPHGGKPDGQRHCARIGDPQSWGARVRGRDGILPRSAFVASLKRGWVQHNKTYRTVPLCLSIDICLLEKGLVGWLIRITAKRTVCRLRLAGYFSVPFFANITLATTTH